MVIELEKIGIIDLGSNTARLLIMQIMEDGHFVVLDQLKETPRLGEGMERDGFLKPVRIQATIRTLKMFRKLCDSYGIEKIIAVATAVVRHAKNQRSFLDEVAATCGIKFRVLTAEEEAMYVYKGVINTMDIPKGIILEIGGGSTKIVYYNRRNLLAHETLPFGSITLTELFANDGLSTEEQAQKVEEFFTEQLTQIPWLKTVVDFTHTYNLLKSLDLDKKKKIRGISSGRADILPSALAAINAFKKYMNLGNIVISASGVRTGLMFNYAVPLTVDKPITDVLGFSLNTLTQFFNCNREHTDQVVNLSVQLFKQLRVLHKFPRQHLKILKVAATLHDVGTRIRYYGFENNSGYIILNSEINGLSHRDLVLAAFVAANNSMEDVNLSEWQKYKDLVTEDDLEAVRKMGIMLRIADALDRSMGSIVKSINCDILGDSVIMKTEVEGDAALEINSALNIGGDFRKVFKKNLEIL